MKIKIDMQMKIMEIKMVLQVHIHQQVAVHHQTMKIMIHHLQTKVKVKMMKTTTIMNRVVIVMTVKIQRVKNGVKMPKNYSRKKIV